VRVGVTDDFAFAGSVLGSNPTLYRTSFALNFDISVITASNLAAFILNLQVCLWCVFKNGVV
jgi:hypothetical protein